MAMSAEELATLRTKKANVRRAHRASATRFINQVDDTVESRDGRRLRQLKQSLSNKLTVLSKLDDEVFEEDAEVEQADGIREKIELAILTIEDALQARQTSEDIHVDTSRASSERPDSRASGSGDETGEDEREPPPVVHDDHSATTSSTADLSASTHTTTVSSTPPVTMTLPSSSLLTVPPLVAHSVRPPITVSFPYASTVLGALPHSTSSSASTTLAPPILSVSGLSPPSVVYSAPYSVPGVLTESPYSVPRAPPHSTLAAPHPPFPHAMAYTPAHAVIPRVKLPKLSIKRFNGDLTKWVTYWDSFNSSIHSNPSLSSVDKFNYLMSLVESSAADAIAGLTITSANYDEAIDTLRRRFGDPQLIVNRHMEALLGVVAVSSHLDIKGLRTLHDTVESHVRGLRALGMPAESYGGLLTSILVGKLPSEIRLIVSREMTAGKWDLDGVMKILEREVVARERASTTGTPPQPPPR